MSKPMTQEELQALVRQVQGELDVHLTAEQTRLSKAHPGEEDSSELPADESSTADASAPPSPEASGPPADASPDASAPPMDGPPDASAPPADASAAGPDAGGGDPMADPGVIDPAAIQAELAQMPPEHVKALYLACKAVIFAAMGGSPDASAPPAPGPDASAPPMPAGPPAGPPDASPALKAETNPANGGKTTVAKSDKDEQIEVLTKKVAEFEGITSTLLTVVQKVISVPPRKAVAGVSELQKNSAEDAKSLAKDEVNTRLNRAARTKLSKSDRELINQYSVGAIDVSKVSHLLDVK